MSKFRIGEELKKLQSMRVKIESEFKALKHQKEILGKEITQKHNALQEIDSKINKLKQNSKEPIITEHAVLRYFERVLGFDLNKIKEEILSKEAIELIQKLGDGEYSINRHKVKVKNNTIITLISSENDNKKVKNKSKKDTALNNTKAEELLKVLNGEIELKKCRVCGEEKELSKNNFYGDKRTKDGYKNICIECLLTSN